VGKSELAIAALHNLLAGVTNCQSLGGFREIRYIKVVRFVGS
jgi:hypothetical protein